MKCLHYFPFETFYAVYDGKAEHYGKPVKISVPASAEFGRGFRSACTQVIEEENGDILMPVYAKRPGEEYMMCGVYRFAFDGEKLTFLDSGNFLEWREDRGMGEPSLCRYHGRYYLTLRTDARGLFAVSEDGLHFSEAEEWKWDTGYPLPTYNTQSHWLILEDKLFLVYTRKAGCNDHVFRHRAPLFMAEVSDGKPKLLRHTERIAIPERGARLGNFGVIYDEQTAYISVSEWMQPLGCEKYGSDNSFWIEKLTAER
ncbi:MAG: hypothetical protein MJ078_07385 [Clostridia bacterium]|nr:hypothetical protein [Clostridia bacterium]